MPAEPTPSEDIATLLDSPNQQRVDVLALVVGVGEARVANTGSGQRTIVDVTIRDQSGPSGASECEFPLFFKQSEDGDKELEALRHACSQGSPVALCST